MKKTLILLSTALAFGACTSEPELVLPDTTPVAQTTEPGGLRSVEEAIDIASRAMTSLYPATVESRTLTRHASPEKTAIVTGASSRAGETDTLLYVVNFDDNKGYAIITAHPSDDDVLAVVGSGSYDPEQGTENPGLNLFMERAVAYSSTIIIPPFEKDVPPKMVIDTLMYYHCNSRLGDLSWGVNGIYGMYAPNNIAGCAPSAIATMVTYFNWFENQIPVMNYTYPAADIKSEKMDWAQLYSHKYVDTYDKVTGTWRYHRCFQKDPEASHKTIARLMRQIGHDAGSIYGLSKTSTTLEQARNVIVKYLPELDVTPIKDFDSKYVTSVLDRGFVFLMAFNSTEPHMWLGTAYDLLKVRIRGYEWDYTNKVYVLRQDEEKYYSMTYMHWGWNGLDDGWFNDNVFKTRYGTFSGTRYIGVSWKK